MKRILFMLLCFVQILQAQTYEISQKANDVIRLLSKSDAKWNVSVSENEVIPLQWNERKNSLTKKGFRTFVGYNNDTFMATISIHSSKISGQIFSGKFNYKIDTSDNGYLTITPQENHHEKPHTDEEIISHEHHHELNQMKNPTFGEINPESLMKNDNILRVYRLAVCIGYPYFSEKFNHNVDNVKAYWSQIETFLNEIYRRDLGVRFEIVENEALILNQDNDVNYYLGPSLVASTGYSVINELIGVENYDAGIIVTKSSSNSVDGAALTEGVYTRVYKAYAMSVDNLVTIGHELGHLFGSGHTFTTGGSASYYTETGRGQSIMSYGPSHYRDFFSLVSSYHIRNRLKNNLHYTEETKEAVLSVPENWGKNPTLGIETNNTAPVIDRTNIKAEYTIPRDTYFQFYIKSKDNEQDELTYFAHQADINQVNARFWTFKPQKGNDNIAFQSTYDKVGLYEIADAKPSGTGNFTFWLGVNDYDANNINHATMYDMVATKVKIVEGTPFKITTPILSTYSAGSNVTLNWDVDPMFEGTKVRILMSDDFGETFKYVLANEADNNGSYTITIPPITLGRQYNYLDIISSGKGLFKIEVVDHIAHYITNNNPNNGGFEIVNTGISFHNLPTNVLTVNSTNEVPEVANVTATTACTTSNAVVVNFTETQNNNIITRTWTATDSCNNTATYTQTITVLNNATLNVDEINLNKETITLYPNPVKDVFYLEGLKDINRVKVYDSLGRIIKSFNEKQNAYNVTELDNGTYIVVVELKEGSSQSFKVIKK